MPEHILSATTTKCKHNMTRIRFWRSKVLIFWVSRPPLERSNFKKEKGNIIRSSGEKCSMFPMGVRISERDGRTFWIWEVRSRGKRKGD